MNQNRNLLLQLNEDQTFDLFAVDLGGLHLARGGPVLETPDLQVGVRLSVDVPEQWPDCFILSVEIENRGEQPLTIQCLSTLRLNLDPAWAQGLWTLQGAAVIWGQDFAFPLPEAYTRTNFLGHRDFGEGGGIPLNYFWNQKAGLSLAHIEKEQVLWNMPVRAGADTGTQAAFETSQPIELAPGEIFRAPRLLISYHHGDFYAPLALYRKVMEEQGLRAPEPAAEDYEPAWCSWGYEFDVRPEEIIGVLPVLQELGIHWLTLDDRWFETYGDWQPRPDTFPGGEDQIRQLTATIHAAGAYAQIWWYPLCAEDGVGSYDGQPYSMSRILKEHPEWVILHPDGRTARNNRGLAILCPGLAEVREYTLQLSHHLIDDWGFDGHKLDNIYDVAPCYNPAHQHAKPEEALEGFAQVYAEIFQATRQSKAHSVTQICPCGTPMTHTLIPSTDQVVTADPTNSAQIRQRTKFYKALMGPRFPVFADHVELSDGGIDFASEIGTGGIPATKFVWPPNESACLRLVEYWPLTAEKMIEWKKWFSLSRQNYLQDGEYLNLYDLAFDVPEAHAIRKASRIYYTFYTHQPGEMFEGMLQLRGLDPARYQLTDYANQRPLGEINGPQAEIQAVFQGALLLEARKITI